MQDFGLYYSHDGQRRPGQLQVNDHGQDHCYDVRPGQLRAFRKWYLTADLSVSRADHGHKLTGRYPYYTLTDC